MNDLPVNKTHLSTLEQISPQAYTRFILCFGLRPDFTHDDATQMLRQGLEATAVEVPVLRSVTVSTIDSNGRITNDISQQDIEIFNVRDLTSSVLNFGEIRSQGFPSHIFDGNMLCPTGIFAMPGSSVPIFLAQANLVNGGLLLGLSVWHQALDGAAIATILRLWAQNCCTLEDPKIKSHDLYKLSADAFNKSHLSGASPRKGNTLHDHPDFLLLPEPPAAPAPALTRILKTQIFSLSPDSISALKELASPSNATSTPTKISWISTNAAISALTWRSVMAATYAHQQPLTDSTSTFGIAMNVRTRMSPPLASDLIASAWCFQTFQLPIKTLLDATLADIALVIRKATEKVDAMYIYSLISMIDGVSNPSLLMPVVLTDMLRTGSIFTSWAGFRMYDFDWGRALGGRCERVRTAASGMFNGMQVVLPELTKEMGGGLEIVIGLEDDAMARLKSDELWMRYARML